MLLSGWSSDEGGLRTSMAESSKRGLRTEWQEVQLKHVPETKLDLPLLLLLLLLNQRVKCGPRHHFESP